MDLCIYVIDSRTKFKKYFYTSVPYVINLMRNIGSRRYIIRTFLLKSISLGLIL